MILLHNERLVGIPFHAEKSLADAVGKSSASVSKIQEFSWRKGKLTKLSNPECTETMNTSDDQDISVDQTLWHSQRLIEENSEYLNYISEYELVKLLGLAIRYKFVKPRNAEANFEPDIILNAIFSASFTDAFLMQFIRQLSLEESMLLIEVLLSFLSHGVCSQNSTNKNPSNFQIFNWIFLVYQAHMEALLLSKDKKCIQLSRKLCSCLLEKIKEYEDYDNIQNLLLILQNKTNMLPEQYVTGKYCIESLST